MTPKTVESSRNQINRAQIERGIRASKGVSSTNPKRSLEQMNWGSSALLAPKRHCRIHPHRSRRRQQTCHQSDDCKQHRGSQKRQRIERPHSIEKARQQPRHRSRSAYTCSRAKQHHNQSSTQKQPKHIAVLPLIGRLRYQCERAFMDRAAAFEFLLQTLEIFKEIIDGPGRESSTQASVTMRCAPAGGAVPFWFSTSLYCPSLSRLPAISLSRSE